MVEQRTIAPTEIKDLPTAIELIKVLLARVILLEEEVARLKKNSSNSSKPPSSDITKPASEQRQPGKRKIGGQPRHPGKQRDLLPREKVDHVVPLPIECCPDCGDALQDPEEPEDLISQTVELQEKPIIVTEYHRAGRWCDKCGKMHYASLPDGVIEGQLCGPRLQALLGYMKGHLGASYTELQQFCADVLGLEVSRAMICRTIARVNQALEIPYQELGEHIRTENDAAY